MGENVYDLELNIEDTETIVFDYIDNVVTELDKEKIKRDMSDLMKEAQSMEIV